jgi:hypothetical protein
MKTKIKTVNIKDDRPTVEVALKRLRLLLEIRNTHEVAALKIVHGYGSTGKGGDIGKAVRKYLASPEAAARVRVVVPGEKFSIFEPETQTAFQYCDDLRTDADLEKYNHGITIVVLKGK